MRRVADTNYCASRTAWRTLAGRDRRGDEMDVAQEIERTMLAVGAVRGAWR